MYRYTKNTLLAFAKLPCCQSRPDGIDPVLWSDLAYSKSPLDDLPEWSRPIFGGATLQSCPRRKSDEEEPLSNAFSISYPPRLSGPWVEHNGTQMPLYDRPGPLGWWDHNGDRDRERGRLPQNRDTDKRGSVSTGGAGQRPWVERDGLLGSGNRPVPPAQDRMGRSADSHHPSRPHIKCSTTSNIRKESLLDKLFANITPTIVDVVLPSVRLRDEPLIAAPEEYNRAESISKTSKFAHWFPGEEDKFLISQSSSLKNFSSLGNCEQTIYSTSLKKDFQNSVGLTPVVKVGCSVGLPIPVAPPSEDVGKGFAGMGEVPHTREFTFFRNDCMGKSNAPSKQPFASVRCSWLVKILSRYCWLKPLKQTLSFWTAELPRYLQQ